MNRAAPDRRPVVAVVVTRNGLILIARRSGGGRHSGLWEYPGGKMEKGESPGTAARREIREELGLTIGDVRWLGECWEARGGRRLFCFLTARVRHSPRRHPCHDRVAWVRVDALARYALAPVDRRAGRVFAADLRRCAARSLREGR